MNFLRLSYKAVDVGSSTASKDSNQVEICILVTLVRHLWSLENNQTKIFNNYRSVGTGKFPWYQRMLAMGQASRTSKNFSSIHTYTLARQTRIW